MKYPLFYLECRRSFRGAVDENCIKLFDMKSDNDFSFKSGRSGKNGRLFSR